MRKMTYSEFTARVQPIHPQYDFSRFLYLGNGIKSTVLCPRHGSFQAKPNSLLNGSGCPQCWEERRGSALSMSYAEFLEHAMRVHGGRYSYSEDGWINGSTKIDIVCPEHGVFAMRPSTHIRRGSGCPKCGKQSTARKLADTQSSFIAKCIAVHGDTYDLSRVQYNGSTGKIEVVCREHGSFFTRAGNFINRASGCPKCRDEATSQRCRNTFEKFLQQFREAHGEAYEYVEIFYEQGRAFIKAVCPRHGEFVQLATDHAKGIGCQKCAYTVFDQESFLSEARKIHGDKYDYSKAIYIRAVDKVTIICPVHGEFQQAPTYHAVAGQGCRKCSSNGPSRAQIEIKEFVETYFPSKMDYVFSGKKEIDIYVPDLRIGIEFHGLIWHSSKYCKMLTHIKEKTDLAAEQGIRLVHVFSDEWEFRQQTVKKTLMSLLGVDRVVYARQTRIIDVDCDTANRFLEENHLQGAINGNFHAVGLEYQGQLVATMAFSGITSVRGATYDTSRVELRRYASSATVVGGASRLFKYWRFKNPSIASVISYSDNRLFVGKVYQHMGFTKTGRSAPDYCYVSSSSKRRHNKAKFQRQNLQRILGGKFNPELSEVENCARAGWYRLFDCGKTRWEWVR